MCNDTFKVLLKFNSIFYYTQQHLFLLIKLFLILILNSLMHLLKNSIILSNILTLSFYYLYLACISHYINVIVFGIFFTFLFHLNYLFLFIFYMLLYVIRSKYLVIPFFLAHKNFYHS